MKSKISVSGCLPYSHHSVTRETLDGYFSAACFSSWRFLFLQNVSFHVFLSSESFLSHVSVFRMFLVSCFCLQNVSGLMFLSSECFLSHVSVFRMFPVLCFSLQNVPCLVFVSSECFLSDVSVFRMFPVRCFCLQNVSCQMFLSSECFLSHVSVFRMFPVLRSSVSVVFCSVFLYSVVFPMLRSSFRLISCLFILYSVCFMFRVRSFRCISCLVFLYSVSFLFHVPLSSCSLSGVIYGMGSPDSDWHVSMFDTHLRRILFVYCPGHTGVKGNDRADRLAGKAAITGGLRLGRSEIHKNIPQFDLFKRYFKPLLKQRNISQ